MATFYTDGWTGSYSSYTRQFKGYFNYTITDTSTAYTITVTEYGIEKVSTGATTFEGSSATVSLSGAVTASTTKSFSSKNKIDFGSGANSQAAFWTGSNAVTINKTTSTQTATIKLSASKASGAWHGSDTKTLELTIGALPTYTIKYYSNNGSGSIPNQTKQYGQSIGLATADSGITRSGYTLTGWNTNSSGTGTAYALGATYSTDANLDLYAVWKLNYIKPTISNLKVERVAISGNDTSDNVKVSFSYTGGSTNGGTSYITPTTRVIKIGSNTYNPTLSASSGSVSFTYGTYLRSTSYAVSVQLADANDGNVGTTIPTTLPAAKYPLAISADGTAMGVMHSAVTGVPLTLPDGTAIDGNLNPTQIKGVTVPATPKFTDTTYSSLAAASGGTDVSLVTTGEKYNWNQAILTVEDFKDQITTGITGLSVVSALKYGKVCQIEFNLYRSTSTNGGADAFAQNLTSLPYLPACDVQGVGYYSSSPFVCWLTTTGKITLRNASGTSRTPNQNNGLFFSVTYICQ